MSNSQEMRRIMKLMESVHATQELEMDFDTFESLLMRLTADVAREWKDSAKDGYTERPAAPNTGSFIARGYGMIEPKYNIDITAGYQGMFTRRYVALLQIGSDLSPDIRKGIIEDFKTALDMKTGFASDIAFGVAVTEDGIRLHYDTVAGTAWGGVGVWRE